MPVLRIDQFRGLAPRFDRRRLPFGAAQIAVNLRFDSGDLTPLQTPAGSGLAPLGVTGANIGRLFAFDRQGLPLPRLIPFGRNLQVTGARGPVPDDQFSRWYWCVAGEGLRAISLANPSIPTPNGGQTGAGSNYRPFVGYRAGIPAPKVAPVAEATESGIGEVGWSTGTAITSIARTNPITINTSAEPPFSDGQRVVFRVNPDYPRPDPGGGDLPPDNPAPPGSGSGQVWALDGLTGVVANAGPSSFDVVGVSGSQFVEFTAPDLAALQVRRNVVDQDLETRAYVFTYVSEFDEEGPPSPPSNIIDVLKDGGVEISLSDTAFQDADGGTRAFVNRIRVYRTVAGQSTVFLPVGTLNFVGGASPDSDLEWVSPPSSPTADTPWSAKVFDGVPAVSLGNDQLVDDRFPPPIDLQGIAMMPNGIIAGWRGNTVQFCEPYKPHSWPPDYRLTFPDDVVGCESFGNSLVVGTRGRPFLVSGVDSASMIPRRMEHHAPLLRPGLIADAGSGVIYCSDLGLVWVGQGGTRILTPQFTKETWLEFVGGRTELVWFDNFALLHGGDEPPVVLSMVGESMEASRLTVDFSCAARYRNSLAVVTRQGISPFPYRLVEFLNEGNDAGGPIRMSARYRSGMLSSRQPLNYAVGQVIADRYPVVLQVRVLRAESYNEPITGQPDLNVLRVDSYVATGPEPFRMVSGYVTREIEIEVHADSRVQSVLLSTSFDELRATPV